MRLFDAALVSGDTERTKSVRDWACGRLRTAIARLQFEVCASEMPGRFRKAWDSFGHMRNVCVIDECELGLGLGELGISPNAKIGRSAHRNWGCGAGGLDAGRLTDFDRGEPARGGVERCDRVWFVGALELTDRRGVMTDEAAFLLFPLARHFPRNRRFGRATTRQRGILPQGAAANIIGHMRRSNLTFGPRWRLGVLALTCWMGFAAVEDSSRLALFAVPLLIGLWICAIVAIDRWTRSGPRRGG